MGLEAVRAELIRHLSLEVRDRRVLEVMERIPREVFVPQDSYYAAYEDRPLSIGYGQTISQPFIIALMTEALKLKGSEKVLEVGTGSGYQAAILAELAKRVITVDRLPQLVELARQVLERFGYANVEVHVAGRNLGWSDEAPYDAIMVTAAAPSVPQVLLDQLSFGGRLVIPVGSRWEQELLKITKRKKQNSVENLGGCRFVPLVGEGAWEE